MPALPKQVRRRLAEEFRLAVSKVAEAKDIDGKLYYFSVFYGETSRQLNVHWDPDLALLHLVTQAATQIIRGRMPLPIGAGFSPDGLPDGFLGAIDQVSDELAAAFEGSEIDMARFYAALARIAELVYVTTGNGAYLYEKGLLTL